MYAVISTGGKQYTVREGDTIAVENLAQEAGSEVKFDQVLLVADDEKYGIGKPVLKNAAVLGELLREEKGEKIDVFKFKRRKKSRRKIGHRQKYSLVKIKSIVSNGN